MVQSFNSDNERIARGEEKGIFSNNFGGLNTTSADINCPYTDTPNALNVDITITGEVEKRKGTKVLADGISSPYGYVIIPFISNLKYEFFIEKAHTSLRIYTVSNDVVTLQMSKLNVWTGRAGLVKATYTRTSEYEPRIIFCTGSNHVVQLHFVEQQAVTTSSGSNYSLVNATRYANATTSNTIVFKNRVQITPSSISYSSGTLTINGTNHDSSDVIDVVLITWQHFAESLRYYGRRFAQNLTRFNVVDTDQNVLIPADLADEPEITYESEDYRYGVLAYESTLYGDTFSYQNDNTPANDTEYSMGDGGRYNPSIVGNTTNPSPNYFTFGDIAGTGSDPPTQVMAVRRRSLDRLNGGVGVQANRLVVKVDGVTKTRSTNNASATAGYGHYYVFDNAGVIETTTSDPAFMLSFEAATNIGVPELADIDIIHTSTTYIGTGANSIIDDYTDGGIVPCYGLGQFANYSTSSFPANVAVFENRLVFSGFPADPLRLIFSGIGDRRDATKNYRFFQIDDFSIDATDPLDINIGSLPNDYVVALIKWQRSLFVFTRKAVFRVLGGEAGFTNTSNQIYRVATVGLVCPQSVVTTDSSIVFLSDVGVYEMVLGVDSQDFQTEEKSLKIRNKFNVTSQSKLNLAWMAFDSNSRKLYLGYPINELEHTSFHLYVFNTYRQSWTEYYTPGYFQSLHATEYIDTTKGSKFLLSVAGYRASSNGVPLRRTLLQTEYDRFIDFAQSSTANGSTTEFFIPVDRRSVTITTTDKVHQYFYSVEKRTDYRGFNSLPVSNVYDVEVLLNGVILVPETDYLKLKNNSVYLIQNPGSGDTLIIRSRLPVTDGFPGQRFYSITAGINNHEPVVVYEDNVLQFYGTQYQTIVSGFDYKVQYKTSPTNYTPANNQRIEWE